MKLNNGKNVIFDSDITMTNSHLGETLDEILDILNKNIAELRRNVKFLYLYGGIGTRGGGGSSSGDWLIYATLGPYNLKIDNNIISLDGPNNNCSLKVYIQKVSNISAFSISYTYKNAENPKGITMTPPAVTISNGFSLNASLNLNINGDIVIEVTSEDGERKSVQASYITNPYTFTFNFGDDSGKIFTESNPNFFISTVLLSGLYGYLNYSIGINGIYSYTYTDFLGTEHPEVLIDISEDKEGKIKLPLADLNFYINDNGGFYSILLKIKIVREGYLNVEISRTLNCNLIPNNLYLKISPTDPNAILYNNIFEVETDNLGRPLEGLVFEYSLGQNAFTVLAFEGSDRGAYYNLTYSLLPVDNNSSPVTNNITILQNRVVDISLRFGKSGWNCLSFTLLSLEDMTNIYTVLKYVYVTSSTGGLEWEYFTSGTENKGVGSYKLYCINISGLLTNDDDLNVLLQLLSYFPGNILQLSPSVLEKKLIFSKDSTFFPKEFILNISILLSSLNKSSDIILLFIDGQNTLSLTLNSFSVNSDSSTIYIPKTDSVDPTNFEKYHLITIYKRFYRLENLTSYYEYSIYIDGYLENVLKTFSTIEVQYGNLLFNNILYSINLFDLIYYTRALNGSVFNDAEITKYYYVYLSKYLGLENSDKIIINNIVNEHFTIDTIENGLDTGMVTVSSTGLSRLGEIASLPMILVFNGTDNITYDEINSTSNYSSNFLKWYLWTSTAGTGGELSEDPTGTFRIGNIQYKPSGESGFVTISTPNNVYFEIEKQGTSTKTWFAKNLDLIINSNDNTKTYLYSPNLLLSNENDSLETLKLKYNTFLPELRFTLKKDVVDSSHSNNNSVADFVNNNTTKFNTGDNQNTGLEGYVKNCLTGFPCLVFMRSSYINPISNETTTRIYYLGYYNFNLGRASNYNLGYKPLNDLIEKLYDPYLLTNETEVKTSLLNGFNIYYTSGNTYKSTLMVAEVLENTDYYDFSQFHLSILFGFNDDDKATMWGDYVPKNSTLLIKNKISEFVRKISRAGGYIFEYLNKNFGPNSESYNAVVDDINSPNYGKSKNQVPNYKKQAYKYINETTGKLEMQDNDDTIVLEENLAVLSDLISAIVNLYDNNSIAALNYTSVVEYYTIAMAFSMVDSVQKNLNIKSWNSGNTWYVAFYDMDTCLGIDNKGNSVIYNAFSDYWDLINSNSEILLPGTAYRDFWPLNSGDSSLAGFDIPSSYLLAIAKYAKLALGDNSEDIEDIFPLSLWARYRSPTGDLRNAKYFIDKYYYGRISSVEESLMNYNYRATYLSKNPQGLPNILAYPARDITKFRGNCRYNTEDWLNERLHIMDVYMGLLTKNPTYNKRPIQYYDEINDLWRALIINNRVINDLNIENGNAVVNNNDIIIFNDIFGNEGIKYGHTINVNIKALENSFIVVTTDDKVETYMILDPNLEYTFNPIKTGPTLNNFYLFGGSDRWTYISDISLFIHSNSLLVNSNNLLNFKMLPSASSLNSSITGRMPSVKDIDIKGSGYTFTLDFNNPNNDVFPGVLNIDISLSGVNLNITLNSTITSIIAELMESSSLKALNCTYLDNLQLGGTISSEVTINPYNKSLILDSLNTKKLNLRTTNYSNTITILNNELLEELTLDGYKTITLIDCHSLNKVIINNPQTVEKITISKCSNLRSKSTPLSITSTGTLENGIVDLSACINLLEIDFSGGGGSSEATRYFTKIILPNGVKLHSSCFYGSYLLEEIESDGRIYITGPNTFRWTAIRNIDCIYVDTNVTDLSYTFYVFSGGTPNLELTSIQNFLNRIPDNNNITNVSCMFVNLNKIDYNKTNNYSEYRSGKCSINLSKLSNVTDASYMFARTKITFFNKYIFRNFGVDNSVNFTGIFGLINGGTLYCTHDSLLYLMGKSKNGNFLITFLPLTTYAYNNLDSHNCKINLINSSSSGELSETIGSITSFFNYNLDKITGIYCVNFSKKYNIRFLFSDNQGQPRFLNLIEIYHSFNDLSISDSSELGLKNLLNLKYIFSSFLNFNSTGFIDLCNLLNWSNFKLTSSYTPSGINSGYGGVNCVLYNSFTPAEGSLKKVSFEDYNKILSNEYGIKGTYSKVIGNIFLNTLIVSNDNVNSDITPEVINDLCDELNNTFNGTKVLLLLYSSINLSDYNNEYTLPLNIDNIVSKFINCKKFIGTFLNIILYQSLPYNFFKRRILRKLNVYSIRNDNGNLVPNEQNRIYCYYDYTKNILDLTRCFYNVKIDKTINGTIYETYFDPRVHSGEIENNKLTDLNGLDIQETLYFDSAISTLVKTILSRTEISDVENVLVHYNYDTILLGSGWTLEQESSFGTLSSESKEYDYLFFAAPDLLYGCTNDCNLTSCFEQCNFSGALPSNFIYHMTNPVLNDWIKCTDIMPLFVGEYKLYSDNKIKRIYTFIPLNFTKITSFSETKSRAFNFYTRLPNSYTGAVDEKIISYYIFLDTSFNGGLSKLLNSLPIEPRTWDSTLTVNNVSRYRWYLTNNGTINYNIMFNTKNITEDSDNNLYVGDDGFSFNSCDIILLFNWAYIGLGNGFLFSSDKALSTFINSSSTDSTKSILIMGLSLYITFPKPCNKTSESILKYLYVIDPKYSPANIKYSNIRGGSAEIKNKYNTILGVNLTN